jgi:hypothetical protein
LSPPIHPIPKSDDSNLSDRTDNLLELHS